MLMGSLTKNSVTYVCILELQKMTLLWKEVDRNAKCFVLGVLRKVNNFNLLGQKWFVSVVT